MQVQLSSLNRFDCRSKWIEEVIFENQSNIEVSWNENAIGIERIDTRNHSQKNLVRLIWEPEWNQSGSLAWPLSQTSAV